MSNQELLNQVKKESFYLDMKDRWSRTDYNLRDALHRKRRELEALCSAAG